MEDIANLLVDKWKLIIESIYVKDFSKKVESVNLFRMDNYYNGYPEIEYCYKVTFNFEFSSISDPTKIASIYDTYAREWNSELEKTFIVLFGDGYDCTIDEYQSYVFGNEKVDYMTNQGYRFIVEFYPSGFIGDLREDKLKELGI
jgi:hypothetical protein